MPDDRRRQGQRPNEQRSASKPPALRAKKPPEDKIIEAQGFLLRDHEGRLRGSFALDEMDQPTLAMFDEEENPRLGMMVLDDGSATVDLLDETAATGVGMVYSSEARGLLVSLGEETPQVFLGVDGGEATLEISDREGNPRIKAGLGEGQPHLVLYDAAGQARIALSLDEDGEAQVSVLDEESIPRALLTHNGADGPSLQVCDQEGQVRAFVSVDAEGKDSTLLLFDGEATPRVALMQSSESNGLEVMDAAGSTRLLLLESGDGQVGATLHDAEEQPVVGVVVNAEGQTSVMVEGIDEDDADQDS